MAIHQKGLVPPAVRVRLCTFALVFAFFALSKPETVSGQAIIVPPDHAVVEFLRRLETRGLITGLDEETRPLMSTAVATALSKLTSRPGAIQELSPVEREWLSLLLAEFGRGRAPASLRLRRWLKRASLKAPLPKTLYEGGFDCATIEQGALTAHINPLIYWTVRWQRSDSLRGQRRVFEERHGLAARGRLGNRLGFYFAFTDGREWGAGPYPMRQNVTAPGLGFVSRYGTHLEHDETEALITFSLPWGTFLFGKTANVWGPGYWGQLGLSANATSYDQIQLRLHAGCLRFTWLYGFLRHYIDPAEKRGPNPIKGIVGHRLTALLGPKLDVSLYETVIFARRRWEIAYLNPIMFYRSAEHFLGDEDNATMGASVEWRPVAGLEIYGELFLDDLRTSKIGTGWYGDKWAYLLGGQWAGHLLGWDLVARAEYARIRPYVYSHKDSLLVYQHFISVLGHPSGPNSDQLRISLAASPDWRLRAEVFYSERRHGASPPGMNLGGEWQNGHREGDPLYVPFLSGVREWQRWFGLQIEYRIAYQLGVEVRYEIGRSTNVPVAETATQSRAVFFGMKLDYPGLPR